METKKKGNYITLKEAAKISGYAPDYIGQLIRKGKLPGKQIYNAVAWMTSEEAVRKYMEKQKQGVGARSWQRKLAEKFGEFRHQLFLELSIFRFARIALYLMIALAVGFSLLLFYILSVSVDKKMEIKAIERVKINESLNGYRNQ